MINAPITWFSKKHSIVNRSTFGSEYMVIRIARYIIVALRYKLRMFGLPLDGPSYVMYDNQLVVNNTGLPKSTFP